MDLCITRNKGRIVFEKFLMDWTYRELKMVTGTEIFLHCMTNITLGWREEEWCVFSIARGIIDAVVFMERDQNARILGREYGFLLHDSYLKSPSGFVPFAPREWVFVGDSERSEIHKSRIDLPSGDPGCDEIRLDLSLLSL